MLKTVDRFRNNDQALEQGRALRCATTGSRVEHRTNREHYQDKRMKPRFCPLLLLLAAIGLASCGAARGSAPAASGGYSIFRETMVEMPWPEIQRAAQEGAVVLLPVGIIEEHGPHMGLAADIYQTYNWCVMTRQSLAKRGIRALIAPPYYWGISLATRAYPGTFSVREATFTSALFDIHSSLRDWGFQCVLSFSAHGDTTHNRVYEAAIKKAHDELAMEAYFVCPKYSLVSNSECALFFDAPPLPDSMRRHQDIHAGALEAAEMAAFFPEDVSGAIARTLPPSASFGPLGYWGDPASFGQIPPVDVRRWAGLVASNTAEAIARFLKEKRKAP